MSEEELAAKEELLLLVLVRNGTTKHNEEWGHTKYFCNGITVHIDSDNGEVHWRYTADPFTGDRITSWKLNAGWVECLRAMKLGDNGNGLS